MFISTTLSPLPTFPKPLGLTIGSFDGLHRGHQALLSHLRKSVSDQGTLAVLTFSNHPSQVLTHRPASPLITTIDHKLHLLEKWGANLAFILEFTLELATQTYDEFLLNVRNVFPFSYLVLGAGASLGKGKQGKETQLKMLGQKLGFQVEYVDKLLEENTPISSRRIRELIQTKELKQASRLLGRPYSLFGSLKIDPIHPNQATMELPGLCLPPKGTYPITVQRQSQEIEGEAIIDPSNQLLILHTQKSLTAWDDLLVEMIFKGTQ